MTWENFERLGIKGGPTIKLLNLIKQITSPVEITPLNPLPSSVVQPAHSNSLPHSVQELVQEESNEQENSNPRHSSESNVIENDNNTAESCDSSVRDEIQDYSPVYPIREWVSSIKLKKSNKNFVNILDKGLIDTNDRNIVIRIVVKNSSRSKTNKAEMAKASVKIQLALDIIHTFPKLRDHTTLGYLYLYDPKSCSGLIQERLKTFRKSLDPEKKRRAPRPRSSTSSQLSKSTSDTSTLEEANTPALGGDRESFELQICREYDELYPACSQFENNLQRYTPRVIKYCEAFNADKLEKVSILVQEDDLEAIILLSEIIPLSKPGGGVDSDFTLVINGGAEKPSKQPFMKCNLNDGFGANYRINVDGTDILVGQSTSRAVELLLKAHYVFNIAFCAELQYFYNFLTSFFMEIDKPKGNNSFLNLSILNTQV
ncbi:hypothetical protein QAD02_013800 [Eretmocerus hayati]|uniref:Uncharacterized protein n=1 Tax=Eretmocerus hayati TaxID=131215 RepID=A0ACC2P4G5_9HYME|nr:hypothetical protein QAD02_013800 [Eretmocerus hayati]